MGEGATLPTRPIAAWQLFCGGTRGIAPLFTTHVTCRSPTFFTRSVDIHPFIEAGATDYAEKLD